MRDVFLFVVFLWALGVLGGTPVIRVAPGEPLQEAISRAPAGAVLELGAGLWGGNISLTKSLTLRGVGAGETVIQGADPGRPVIAVEGTAEVVLQGLGVDGDCGPAGRCVHGVAVSGKARLRLISCRVSRARGCGLLASDASSVWLSRSSLSGNGKAGIWAADRAIVWGERVSIEANTFGAIVSGEAELTLGSSSIRENGGDGLLVTDAAKVYLWGNAFGGNGGRELSLDIPGCYRTRRAFTGLVRGEGNRILGAGEKDDAVCPPGLSAVLGEPGGIYPPPRLEDLLARVRAPVLGDPEAPLAVLEFSDLSCPYCAQFALEVLPRLRREFIDVGKLRLYFFPFPVHKGAGKEAEAGFCAGAQGLFWDFQDAVYARVGRGTEPGSPEEVLREIGGDPRALEACLSQGEYAQDLAESVTIGRELGVRGTPTFFVGRWVLTGLYPYGVFREVILQALEELEP